MQEDIFIVGVGMTQFSRHSERSVASLAIAALESSLSDSGLLRAHIEQVFYAGVTQGALQGQFAIPGQVVLAQADLPGIPAYNIENACASGTTAFQLAVQALRAGACDVALALGAEKMNMALFEGGWDVTRAEENARVLLALGEGVAVPEGSESDQPYTRFMAIYAAMCRFWMKTFGTTQRQIAAVSAKNHLHSVHNPLSQYRKPFSVEEVLAAPPITYPLTLPMCSPISDGLKRLGISKARAIKVASSALLTATPRSPLEFDKAVCQRTANLAYERAGLGPDDVSLAEVHDATAMGEIMAAEYLGLAAMGEAGIVAERGDFTIGGRVPVNPSGGLESKGHPIGATGLGQIHELVTQLRGEAGARQVEGAKVAIQENGGGLVGIEEGVVAINIFTR
jgi:acetyl-CoA acetyltransferase